jgi:CBS domain containing-hemolysin-like protein
MNGSWNSVQLALTLGLAGLSLLLDLGLSVALVAVASLSPVALRRMASDAGSRFAFLEDLQRPTSAHRTAAILAQQLSLLVATALFALAARGAGLRLPIVGGLVVGAIVGVLLLQALLARTLALWRPRQTLRGTAILVRAAYLSLYPVVVPLQRLLQTIDANRHLSDEEREEEQEEEVEALIEVGERTGLLEAEEGKMMRGIVDLDETLVREIMTPRTAIVALEAQTIVEDARRTLLEAAHSRLPVYAGSIDNVIGVLHSRDLFQAWESKEDQQLIRRFLRPAVFVPETLSAGDLLTEMRQKTQVALVVDEYGGIAGLVTLEDVLEEIVGEIRDEHDNEEELIHAEAAGTWVVDAVAHVDELEPLFDVAFEGRDFDTVGGLVVSGFGRVPRVGENLNTHGLHIEVLQADNRRVLRVRIRRADPSEEASSVR